MATLSPSKKKSNKRSSNSRYSQNMDSSSSSLFNCTRKYLLFAPFVAFVLVVLYVKRETPESMNFVVPTAEICSVEVVNEFPHDPKAFTQGLLYGGNDTLFESTGLYGKSSVRQVVLQTGKVEVLQEMNSRYFGEGLTLFGDRLFQVTWLKNTGFIYDRHNLSKYEKFNHQMPDGWGLATDGQVLFGSDGSSILYQLDPSTLKVIGKATVKYKGHMVHNLNELEYVNGEVWANVWQTDCIARISPKDGIVVGWIVLPELRQRLLRHESEFQEIGSIDVLNGIAWDEENGRLFVTGKQWPKLYEIKLHPIKGPFVGSIERLCLRRPFISQSHRFTHPKEINA
ncbi:hypothetical protein Sjap_020966 [Stephania japonica]|uniref:Glutaminyl-peptide cyclotransferase n=1 Tax=Stephania japonica TaxID=461633 RepID=A0AAP0F795_9MAGN